jgi:hypothetical protein
MRTKMGNEFPKMGNSLPLSGAGWAGMSYEHAIALAVRRELGGSNRAIKTLMRRTGASARTAKNWLSGTTGPSGVHLVALMRSSDFVFDAVLRLADRKHASPNRRITEAKGLLRQAASLLESEH